MIDIKITGDRELSLRMDALIRELPLVCKRIVGRSALEVKRLVQLNLSGIVLHVVSNKLRSSIQIVTGGTNANPWAVVGTNTVYAAIHEYGGTIKFKKRRGEVRIPARPFMKTALAAALPAIERIGDEEIKRAIA